MLARLVMGRFDQLDERFDRMDDRFDRMDERFDRMDDRFDRMDERFDRMDDRFEQVETRLSNLEIGQKETNRHLEAIDRKQMGTQESLDVTIPRSEFTALKKRVTVLETKFA